MRIFAPVNLTEKAKSECGKTCVSLSCSGICGKITQFFPNSQKLTNKNNNKYENH